MAGNKERLFVKGNEAIAMGALAAGCRCFFGYPITPQNDIPEFMSKYLGGRGSGRGHGKMHRMRLLRHHLPGCGH